MVRAERPGRRGGIVSFWRRERTARLFFPSRGRGRGKLPQALVELCSAHLCEPEEARRRVVAGAEFLKEGHTVRAKTPGGIFAFLGDTLLHRAMVVWWEDNTFSINSSEGWITLEIP